MADVLFRFFSRLTLVVLLSVFTAAPVMAQSAATWDQQGIRFLSKNDFVHAHQAFQQALKLVPDNATTMILDGFSQLGLRHFDAAGNLWSNATHDGRLGNAADILSGVLDWRNGDFEAADGWFSFCDQHEAVYATCKALASRMHAGAAVPPMQQWTALIGWQGDHPDSISPTTRDLERSAFAQIRQGNPDGARKTLARVLDRAPKDGPALVLAGLIDLQAGKNDGASQSWGEANSDPWWANHADVLNGLLNWASPMLASTWFDMCHPHEPGIAACRQLKKRLNAHEPVPPRAQWYSLAGLDAGFPDKVNAVALPGMSRADAPRASFGSAASEEQVTVDRKLYSPNSKMRVTWRGFSTTATGDIWFWPVGSGAASHAAESLPLNGADGSLDTKVPYPGTTYEIRFRSSGEQRVHIGPRFTVGPATAYATTPKGHYGCWFLFYGHGLWRSAVSWVAIDSASRYHDPRGGGDYVFDQPRAILQMTSGPLRGRIAHLFTEVHGRTDLLFTWADNNVKGKATIDNGTTNCYLGQQ